MLEIYSMITLRIGPVSIVQTNPFVQIVEFASCSFI